MVKSYRAWINKCCEINRGLGKYAERISCFLWPWKEDWLLVVAGSLSFLDFLSTYFLLGLNGRKDVYESGFLASRALEIGGFAFLFVVDLIAVMVMLLLAFIARYAYERRGLNDYGRAAFIFILIPYVVVTALVFTNTVVMLLS